MTLNYNQINDQKINVLTKNNLLIGELIMDVDGYFYFWPANDGCWSAYLLHSIANKLDEVNKKWDDQIHEHFNKESGPQ